MSVPIALRAGVTKTATVASVLDLARRWRPSVPAGDDRAEAIAIELIAIVEVERPQAEATLGRPLIDAPLFGLNVWRHGLGHALNVEEDLAP